MPFRVPVADMLFAMRHVAKMDALVTDGVLSDLADGAAEEILAQAGKLAEDVLAPLNRVGDQHGVALKDGVLTTAPGWPAAYGQWREGGWNGIAASPDFGGMGLPHLLNAGCIELWNMANMAFALCPLLNMGAIEAVTAHASDELKNLYLAKMISGEWTGTMNLTEPQAGSDLSALRTKAVPHGDGTYRITGNKIFITYGEHDMAENIVHLVLARLPDAPAGTRGISLFLVPKYLVNADGSLGAHNDLRCSGVEHKLGIHASPTCSMAYGDKGGAIGWLIGEENKGLACMFTMMNNALLGVGLQGVAIAERATQQALEFSRERKQGKAPGDKGEGMSPIILHADIRRNLMTMKALTQAARAICYLTAVSLDLAHRAATPEARKAGSERAGLLTPIAKAFSTDIANEVTSIGVQIHGGMGFIEETGAAQHMRDARIAGIYEGTNGIQAIDLVQRKLPLSDGAAFKQEMTSMRASIDAARALNVPEFGASVARMTETLDALQRASDAIYAMLAQKSDDALAGATPYLRLFGLARGGTALLDNAVAAHRLAQRGESDPAHAARIAVMRFFAENIAPQAGGLEAMVTQGAASLRDAESVLEVGA